MAVKAIVTLTTLIYIFASRVVAFHQCTDSEATDFPHLCSLFASINLHPEKTAKELYEYAKLVGVTIEQERIILDEKEGKKKLGRNLIKNRSSSQESQIPSVLAHGERDTTTF